MPVTYKGGLSRYRRYLQVLAEKPLWGASMYLILTLVLILVMLIFALRPTMITISRLLGETKSLNEVSEQLNHKIATVQAAADELSRYEGQMYLLDEGLPTEPKWVDWTTRLETIAAENGLAVRTVTLRGIEVEKAAGATPEGGSASVKVMFDASVGGSYEGIRQFVEAIEKLRRAPVLTSVEIKQSEDGGLTGTVNGYISYMP